MGRNMKAFLLVIFLVLISNSYGAWQREFSVGGSSLDASAIMQVNSTTKGAIYAPKMTTGERTTIGSLVSGLGVFDDTLKIPYIYNGTGWIQLILASTSQVLTNKTINSDSNLITNIVDADIKSSAAIARTKIASATANYVLINNGSGVFSEEQFLNKTRGGTGITSTATFPASGVVVTEASASVLTNKSIDSDTNTITNVVNADIKSSAAIDRTKLAAGSIGYVLINGGAGIATEEQFLNKTRGGTGITSTATFPASGVVVTEATTQILTNKDYDISVASDSSRLTLGQDTTANLDLLTDKKGHLAYDTTLDTVVVNDGTDWIGISGGGGGAAIPKVVVEVTRSTSGQVVLTTATDIIDWNTEHTDTYNAFDLVTDIFTSPRADYYNILGTVFSGPTGVAPTINSRNVQLELSINGGANWDQIDYNRVSTVDIANSVTQKYGKLGVFLNVGDLIRVRFNNSTNEDMNLAGGAGAFARRMTSLHIVSADGASGVVSGDVIGASVSFNHLQALPLSTTTKMEWDTIENDTHGNFDPTTNYRYTVGAGQAGYYDIDYSLQLTMGAGVAWSLCEIQLNGTGVEISNSFRSFPISGSSYPYTGHATENLAVGDYVEVFCRTQAGTATGISTSGIGSTFSVYKKSTAAGTTEKAVVIASSIAGQSITPAGNTFIAGTEIKDTDGLYNPITGEFICNRNGTLTVRAAIKTLSVTLTTSQVLSSSVYKNGSIKDRLELMYGNGTNQKYYINGTTTIDCVVNDIVRVDLSVSVSTTLSLNAFDNRLSFILE